MSTLHSFYVLCLVSCLQCLCPAIAQVQQIDNEALAEMIDAGVTVIDVRRSDEWKQTGVIEGSHGLTFFDKKGSYDIANWMEKLSALVKPDEPVVLICAHGSRSERIASFLDTRAGFSKVHNVTKGIAGWIKENRSVVSWQP